eukprot:SAG25_NODE_5772_length_622_cov_1.112811_1_plen_75_part_00
MSRLFLSRSIEGGNGAAGKWERGLRRGEGGRGMEEGPGGAAATRAAGAHRHTRAPAPHTLGGLVLGQPIISSLG